MNDLPEVLCRPWYLVETAEETTVVIDFPPGDEIILPWGDEPERWRMIGAAIAAVPDLLRICSVVASFPEGLSDYMRGFIKHQTIEEARKILGQIENLKELDK